ncbi:MAG: hypothetical protein NVS3B12_21200 [Acidimicrobiales bacterium]
MHRLAKAALLTTVVVAAAACGSSGAKSAAGSGSGSSSSGSGSGSSASAGPTRAQATDACPGLSGNLDKSATFTWMYSIDTTSFDKDKITSNSSNLYLYPIYDSLVHIDASGAPQPMLAKSFKLTDGGKSLELSLIDNWHYQDGTPFDAASVKANLERSMTLPKSINKSALKSVTAIDVVDPKTVRITTSGGAGALVGVLGGSAGMMMSPAVFDKPGEDIMPTGGSGAFRLTRYVPGSRVEYAAVKDYWDPKAVNVANLVFLISADDNARLNAVQTGAADATFLRASTYKAAKSAGVVVCQAPSLSVYTLNLNTQRSEFAKQQVRQALFYAIDRKAVAAVTDGFCKPTVQMFPTSYYAANPQLSPDNFAHDPAKAKKLLADAGLAAGFSFNMEVINLALYQQIAEVMQANLAEVGIKMTITPVEIARLAQDFSVKKTADAAFMEQKAESDPSTLTAEYFLPDGFDNPGALAIPGIDALQAATLQGATADVRGPAFAKLFSTVLDQAGPNVPVCNLTTPFAMDAKARGIEIYTDASRQFRGVGIAKS